MSNTKLSKTNVKNRISNYSLSESIKNLFMLLLTKLQYPSARLIRRPIIVRGKKYIDWGKNLTTGYNCRIEVNGSHNGKVLRFGNNINIGDNVSIRCAEKINIGNNVLMGSRVLIIDNAHGNYRGENQDSPEKEPNKRILFTAPVVIGNNVWIGEGAVIQAGVSIGDGSIIAANSVVTKSIKSGVIAAGMPAKEKKKYNENSEKWENIDK